MNIKPIDNTSFGIYKYTIPHKYGVSTIGKYKDYNIEIYYDKEYNTKLYYISDDRYNKIKSKLVLIINNIKYITRS